VDIAMKENEETSPETCQDVRIHPGNSQRQQKVSGSSSDTRDTKHTKWMLHILDIHITQNISFTTKMMSFKSMTQRVRLDFVLIVIDMAQRRHGTNLLDAL
jgi:hypothetical protein